MGGYWAADEALRAAGGFGWVDGLAAGAGRALGALGGVRAASRASRCKIDAKKFRGTHDETAVLWWVRGAETYTIVSITFSRVGGVVMLLVRVAYRIAYRDPSTA